MKSELLKFKTGSDIHNFYISVTLCKYNYKHDDSVEYVVEIFDSRKNSISEKVFNNISAAKRRFLFEVQNTTVFMNLD